MLMRHLVCSIALERHTLMTECRLILGLLALVHTGEFLTQSNKRFKLP